MGQSVRGSHNRGSSRHVSHLSAAHRSLFCYAEPAGPAPPRHVCAADITQALYQAVFYRASGVWF